MDLENNECCFRVLSRMVKKIILVVALVLLVFSFIGCETFKGMGRDIKTAGEAVEETAEGVESRL